MRWDVTTGAKDRARREKEREEERKKKAANKRNERKGDRKAGAGAADADPDEKEPIPTQESTDDCNICWSDQLGQAPSIMLGCGHFFHKACIDKRIESKVG